MRRLLKLITRRLPLRRIEVNGDPYLDRYYVCGPAVKNFPMEIKPILGWLPFTVYIHQFHRDDQDRDLHNHPWKWALSLILAGGYIEEFLRGDAVFARVVAPWTLNRFHAEHFHRVELCNKDAWSVIAVGPRIQTWGFRDRETGEFTHWRDYLPKGDPNLDLPLG